MEIPETPGLLINKEAPTLYRKIAKKFLERYPYRRITKGEAKRILGFCFKVGKYKQKVFKELESYGLIIFIDNKNYYINYVDWNEEIEDGNN